MKMTLILAALLQVKSRAQIVGRPARSYAAIVNGYAFIKGPKELVCLDLRASQQCPFNSLLSPRWRVRRQPSAVVFAA